jgi:Flp pilus assembly protein TadG
MMVPMRARGRALRDRCARPARATTRRAASTRALLRRFSRDQHGGYIVMTSLLMPVLLGFAGMGADYGVWMHTRQKLQGAAHAAAYSAAMTLTGNITANASLQANAVASAQGYMHGAKDVTVTVNQPPKSGNYVSADAVEVIVQQWQPRFLSTMQGSSKVLIAARAVALVGSDGLGCVVSLNKTAAGATTLQGSASVNLSGCTAYSNSSSSSAVSVGGSSTLAALAIGVVGGVYGTSNITTTQGIKAGAGAIKDPYGKQNYPVPPTSCDRTNYTAKNTVSLDPGVYCGGIQLNAGAIVTLSPGIYYLTNQGSNAGELQVAGGATLTGNGVTLVFTSSTGSNYATATINGGATVNLTAPTSGPTAGIAIFGDRNMPTDTAFRFGGGASQIINGAIYVPSGTVDFAGGANSSKACTQLVADTVKFTGNSNFAVNCTGMGTKPLGATAATIVE